MGKSGHAFILDRESLGGIGGELLRKRLTDRPIVTGPAVYPLANAVGVVLQPYKPGLACPATTSSNSLMALRIEAGQPPRLSVAWCASVGGRGAPIVTHDGSGSNQIVWMVDGDASDGKLYGFRADTGAIVFNGGLSTDSVGTACYCVTPIAAEGHLYVAATGSLVAFSFNR